ncbi:MAG: tRNA 4-thiouridine(8) synthase ThiI [Clostridiales bacterium]|jgi:thiamine biosynthesis protein ThiI|nr:tRNA 4-thiouridine(8) synthase ThiI [Clostridiales bacterium]
MLLKKIILVKYGEIALRKGNRALYEKRLMDTLRKRLYDIAGDAIHVLREQGRFVIEDVRGDIDEKAVIPRIRNIFGVTAFCLCLKTDARELADIQNIAAEFFRGFLTDAPHTFKVETKRGDKNYPVPSREVSAAVGGYILERLPGLKVDVHRPDRVLWVEVRTYVYLYVHSEPGEGGLPYGSSGKAVLLLSGGIDSPVAGYLTAKRGVEIVAVYFHSPPYTPERAAEKVKDLTARLCAYTGALKLYVVPFTDVQLYLYENVQHSKLTILLKRSMLKIASVIAEKENAHCLITGDSIGQVASQTILSMEAVDSAAKFPVLRPLCAMDKQQIIEIAKKIGTYEISVLPFEDCCTLFVAEHPESKPKVSVIEGIEKRLSELTRLWEEAAGKACER